MNVCLPKQTNKRTNRQILWITEWLVGGHYVMASYVQTVKTDVQYLSPGDIIRLIISSFIAFLCCVVNNSMLCIFFYYRVRFCRGMIPKSTVPSNVGHQGQNFWIKQLRLQYCITHQTFRSVSR